MSNKHTPRTAHKYAEALYVKDRCRGDVRLLSDYEIVDCRVRAFIDGVRWQKRNAKRSTK